MQVFLRFGLVEDVRTWWLLRHLSTFHGLVFGLECRSFQCLDLRRDRRIKTKISLKCLRVPDDGILLAVDIFYIRIYFVLTNIIEFRVLLISSLHSSVASSSCFGRLGYWWLDIFGVRERNSDLGEWLLLGLTEHIQQPASILRGLVLLRASLHRREHRQTSPAGPTAWMLLRRLIKHCCLQHSILTHPYIFINLKFKIGIYISTFMSPNC